MLIYNPVFVEEVKASIQTDGFSQAVDNFISNKMFRDLAILTPFYMNNKLIIDIILEKYNI
jgi:hypothetical protein